MNFFDQTGPSKNVVPLKPRKRLADDWTDSLAQSKEGGVLPTVANALIILAQDPAVSSMVGYNEFRLEYILTRPPPISQDGDRPMPGPYPRPWTDTDVVMIHAYMQRAHCARMTMQTVQNALLATATMRRFHPVRDYLDGLKWDGKKRIDAWLINAFACDDTPYHRAVGAKVLIAAVRRVKKPGVKFDHMMVLEGPQGLGKSKTVRATCPHDEWFSDAVPADLTSKDAAMALSGVWFLEFAEIEHLIRAEVETIKAFLTRQTDRYRPPYGRAYIEYPRQVVMVGTTNSDDYLRDASGNRRIWPVKCRAADAGWVEVNRDQLWAEAVAREANGEAIWLDDELIRTAATEAQEDRMAEDVWQNAITNWLIGRYAVTTADVLEHAISVPKERMNKAAQMRVANVLKQLGWKSHVRKSRGRSHRVWEHEASEVVGS